MRTVIAAKARTLLSFSNEELIALSNSLNEVLNNSNIDEHDCDTRIGVKLKELKALHQEIITCIKSERSPDTEIFEAWADGCSIQIKAISAYGDPADLGSDEVRKKLGKVIDEAEKA